MQKNGSAVPGNLYSIHVGDLPSPKSPMYYHENAVVKNDKTNFRTIFLDFNTRKFKFVMLMANVVNFVFRGP
jgi:hypothetical protein